ncbi:MAG: hypothetical protein QM811_05895 [Pirellulales bacterium]
MLRKTALLCGVWTVLLATAMCCSMLECSGDPVDVDDVAQSSMPLKVSPYLVQDGSDLMYSPSGMNQIFETR